MRLGLLFHSIPHSEALQGRAEVIESRTGAPAARFSYSPIILLIWTGWTARKEYTDLTKGAEDKHDFRRSNGIPYGSQKKHVASWECRSRTSMGRLVPRALQKLTGSSTGTAMTMAKG